MVKGKKQISKIKKVQHFQDQLIAYQDHSWGDDKIFQGYKTPTNIIVDQYQSGY